MVFVLTACTNNQPANEKVSLNYWSVFEPQENIQELINEFQTKNPNITINYTRKSLKDYRQQVEARAGQTNGPDIFRYHNSWIPQMKGYLTETPQAITDGLNYDQTFYPVVSRDLKANRGYFGIPLMYDGLVLYYNKDLFERAGILKPPTEWGQIIDTAQQLKSPKNGPLDTAGLAMGTTTNVDYWSDIFTLLMYQNNANLTDPLLTRENTETAINFYKQQANDTGVWNAAFPSSTETFAQGKVAMIFGVSWTAFEIQQKNPSLQFATVPVPQLPGSKVGVASYWVEGVANNISKGKQDAAWKFLSYLAQKENMQKMHALQAKNRLFGEPYSRQDLSLELQNNQYLSAVLETAPEAQSFYMADRTFGGGLNDELKDNYAKLLQNPGQIAELDSAIQSTLSKYGVPLQ